MKKTTLLMGRLTLLACLLFTALSFAQTQTFTSSGSFIVPAGVTSIRVEAWGAGGAGGGATGNPSAGGGGAGGAYARNNTVTVTPGNSYTVTVGTGGIGNITSTGPSGGASSFGGTLVVAVGGTGGNRSTTNSNTATGATAPTTGNTGTINFYGGNGGTGVAAGVSGGGGGASAGTGSNGSAAIGVTGGLAVTGGTAGANGSTASADGADATGFGAGGAGARTASTADRAGGNGSDGRVIITWVCPTYSLTSTTVPVTICQNNGATVTLNGSVANLPVGPYTVTYNLTGTNTATGNTSTMTVSTAGTGTFATSSLTTTGATTVTITNLASGGTSPNNCSSAIGTNNTASVTVNPIPVQPSTITGAAAPCIGSSQAYSVTNVAGVTYSWIFPTGWSQTGGGTTNSITVTVGSGSGNVQVTPSNGCGAGTARTFAVAPITTPSQPSTITGLTSPCTGATLVAYSVTNVAGVTYNWTFPSGWTQTGGTNTNSITVTAGNTSGNISVSATNACGTSTVRTLAVTPSAAPAQPSVITGTTSVCQTSVQGYSVTAVAGVTYTWTFPSGWTQTAGGTTNSISVMAGSSSGNITVTPSIACGSGTARTLAVTATAMPTILTTTPGSRVGTGPVNLGATASVGTISWFGAANGGVALGTGTTFTTPDIVTSTTFYIEVTNGSCTTSPRTGVLATVNAPEIAVSGNGYNISDEDMAPETTDYTDFGTVNILISSTKTYTIQNIGTLPLTIGTFTIAGANSSEFILVTSPATTLAAGASTTFSIKFTPTAAGVRNATLSFVTNDSDENPFNFYIRGTGGTGVTPEINIQGLAVTIVDGAARGSSTDGTLFPTTTIGNFNTRTFTIQNTGTGPLTLSNGPNYVAVSGSSFFTVLTQPSGTIAAGASSTFQVRFTPTNTGSAVAIITINNSDDDEGIFDFVIEGTGVITGRDIGIEGNEVAISDGATSSSVANQTDFGITDLTTSITIPFNVYSYGSSSLSVTSTAITAGAGFTISSLSGTVNSGSPTSFVVTFTPTVVGTFSATVTVNSNANNPSSKAAFTFVVTAQVQNLPALTNAPGGVTSNLEFWLKANSEIGIVNDNENVSTWNEQTLGSTKSAIAKFSREPKFKNNAATNINFNPVISFNGASTLYGNQGFNNQDMFIVLKPKNNITSATSAQDIYCGDDLAVNKNSQDVTGFEMGNTSTRYGTNADIVAYNQGANTSYGIAEYNSTKIYSGVNMFNPRRNTATGRMMILCNGSTLSTTEFLTGTGYLPYKDIVNSRYWLGRSEYFDASYEGDILEIINYSSVNSNADKSKIESYLAIKYGITLGVNGVSQDYVDSDGTTIYPSSNGFNYNIAGIGRDDKSQLNQKQSKTENTTNDVTMGLTTIETRNSDNTNTFDFDKNFLIWGSNNGTLGAQAPILVNMSSGIAGLTTQVDFVSIGRTWKVIENGGDVKTVTVSVPSTLLTSTITPPGDFLMFISSSPIFSPTAEYRIMRANGSKLETSYDFNGTTYITFGYAPERTFVRAVSFDGVDDYMDAGNVLNLDNTNFTVSAWIKRNTSNKTIVSKRNSTFTTGYDLMINSGGYAEMSWMNGTKQTITSSVIIPTGKWHNIGVTFDGTNARMYIDGVLDTTEALSPVLTNTQSFIIAAADGTNTTSFFNGTIDEVRVWGTALSAAELRYVMNQELLEHSDNTVNGSIVPQTITLNEVKDIPWSSVKAYYPMSTYTYTNAKDMSDNDYTAAVKNLITVDYQTGPLPYVSTANGDWSSDATWLNSNVQDNPYSFSIVDGTTRIGWNIVRTNHNITTTTNKVVLGMDVQSNKITADNDIKIEVSHYLNLDGKIDLVGKSQLVQTFGSDLDPTSSGTIERDQQGQTNIFNYNYWSSPVSTPSAIANNLGYTINDVFKDATDPDNIKNINWTYDSEDGSSTNPITLSALWVYKFQNVGNAYANWGYIGSNGTLLPGEGFTMKGCGAVSSTQNYTFTGKPNNGSVTLPIGAGFLNLCGNPYASSLDSQQFINDNLDAINGTLYFWEHYSTNTTHVYADYQGGYAALTNVGGTPPVAAPGISGLGSSSRIPKRFIPVGQGFFVVGNGTGGSIKFNNNQRLFVKETSGSSNIMFRNANQTSSTNTTSDNNGAENQDDSYLVTGFSKIRLGFNSSTNYHRQLLLGFMNEYATSAIDPGYDAVMFDQLPDDMYFLNGEVKLIIQGDGFFNEVNVYPLGVKAGIDGNVQFVVDELINFDEDQDVYIYDDEDQSYHDIKTGPYEVALAEGTYESRFSLRFVNATLGIEDQQPNGPAISFTNNNNTINIQNNEHHFTVTSVSLFNVLGQGLETWETKNNSEALMQIPVKNYASGTYIVKINTSTGSFSKKIVIR